MSELSTKLWHKFGRHRLYVNRPDKTCVGYWDLVDNEPHPVDPNDLHALMQEVRRWKAEQPDNAERWAAAARDSLAGGGDEQPTSDRPRPWRTSGGNTRLGHTGNSGRPAPEPVNETVMWTDLAGNPAGAEARKRARDLRSDSWIRAAWHRLRGTNNDERNWRVGADGEEKVGAMLERVAKKDKRWQEPIHSVPVGQRRSDIDHVFVGTGGVFTINVKHHPHKDVAADGEKVRVEGRDRRYVDKSRHEAARASKLLTGACGFVVHVEALIVIVGARHVSVGRPVDGVHIIEASHLPNWLRSRCDIHSAGIVQSVYDAARRSTVWRPPATG